jgi:hypothetical protein
MPAIVINKGSLTQEINYINFNIIILVNRIFPGGFLDTGSELLY